MSDPHPPAAPTEPAPATPTPAEASPVLSPPGYRDVAIGLAGALLLVVVLVGTAPFWAPLLPWGMIPASSDAALAARIERLEAAQGQVQQLAQLHKETAAASAALPRLEQRVGTLEARPAVPPGDSAETRQRFTTLSGAQAELSRRVEALDKAVHSRAGAASDLAARIDAIDRGVHAQTARDMTDMALALALLQIRGAVEAGRPFAAEYDALAALARSRPEIAAAAAPLFEPAKTGVASPAVLGKRLRDRAGTIAGAKPPENGRADVPDPGWADAALARLRGLVTIRRVGGAAPFGGPEASVNAAELALASGDLAGSVAALDKLAGAPAEAAGPWLRMARERLAVDAALQRVATLLTARLGAPSAPVGPPVAPLPAPSAGAPG